MHIRLMFCLLLAVHFQANEFFAQSVMTISSADILSQPSTTFLSTKNIIPAGEVIFAHPLGQPFLITDPIPFNIVDEVGDTLFIYLPVLDSELQARSVFANVKPIPKSSVQRKLFYFLNGPKQFYKYKYRGFTIKPLTVPIKIRPAFRGTPSQMITDVSIGPYVGYEIGNAKYAFQNLRRTSIIINLFATPSLVRLDPSTSTEDEVNNIIALSIGGGILFNVNDFQLGLVTGFDFTGGDAAATWIYQWRQWYSFAVGYDFGRR